MSKILSNDEFYFAIRRYSTLFLGVINAFLLPFVFDRIFESSTFSYLIIISGFMPFLNLMDLGITKPIMSSIRENFINKKSLSSNGELLNLYYIIFVFIGIIYCSASIILFYFKGINEIKLFDVICICLFNTCIVVFTFLKPFFWAINKYHISEKIDLTIRISNLIFLLVLYFFNSISLNLIIIISFLIITIHNNNNKHFSFFSKFKFSKLSFNSLKEYILPFKKNASNNLLFSINETLIYSGGIIILPFFLNDKSIIVYGIFLRLFSNFAIIFRAITDIKIHEITKQYFLNDLRSVAKQLNFLILISLTIAFMEIIVFYFTHDLIFSFLLKKQYDFNNIFIITLGVILISNSIQHPIGTFYVFTGKYFLFLRKLSFYMMLTVTFLSLFTLIVFKELDYYLIVVSTIYFVGSFVYLSKKNISNLNSVKYGC